MTMGERDRHDTTMMLRRAAAGEAEAVEDLVSVLYDQLHGMAARVIGPGKAQTIGPTALIHEAWMRLVDPDEAKQWNGRGHFLRVAARAMRYVLLDRARAKSRHKAGGGRRRITLDENALSSSEHADDILAVEEALQRLGEKDERLAQVVEMRFFGGFSNPEISEAMDLSLRTVERSWRLARAFLLGELSDASDKPEAD